MNLLLISSLVQLKSDPMIQPKALNNDSLCFKRLQQKKHRSSIASSSS